MDIAEKALSFYRCGVIEFDPEVSAAATELANKDCEVRGMDMAEISVINAGSILATQPVLEKALQACEHALGVAAKEAHLVYCEWTWAHVDVDYKNYMFVSVVLATGPEPFCIQALKTAEKAGADLVDTKRVVAVGDVFVLDPRVAHMAAPAHPHNDSLLVLAQWMLHTPTEDAREQFRRRFARLPGDRHQSSMMDY